MAERPSFHLFDTPERKQEIDIEWDLSQILQSCNNEFMSLGTVPNQVFLTCNELPEGIVANVPDFHIYVSHCAWGGADPLHGHIRILTRDHKHLQSEFVAQILESLEAHPDTTTETVLPTNLGRAKTIPFPKTLMPDPHWEEIIAQKLDIAPENASTLLNFDPDYRDQCYKVLCYIYQAGKPMTPARWLHNSRIMPGVFSTFRDTVGYIKADVKLSLLHRKSIEEVLTYYDQDTVDRWLHSLKQNQVYVSSLVYEQLQAPEIMTYADFTDRVNQFFGSNVLAPLDPKQKILDSSLDYHQVDFSTADGLWGNIFVSTSSSACDLHPIT